MKNRGKWDMKAGSFQCDGDSTCLEKEEEVEYDRAGLRENRDL